MNVVLPESVRAYVAAVRAHLVDLPREESDDLTGGLEADLAERAAELPTGTDLAAAFGSPEAYAAELRSAAGLPPFVAPAAEGRGPGSVHRFELWLRARREELLTRLPWLRELRPVWWLARGFILGAFLAWAILGGRRFGVVLFGLAVAAASFWWSRERDSAPSSGRNRLTLLANALATVLCIPVLAIVAGSTVQYVEAPVAHGGPMGDTGSDGVWVNGEGATNLYAYDAEGNRIDRVRLFNQYGQAVTISMDSIYNANGGVPEDLPLDSSGSPDAAKVNRSVFPMRWGVHTGWEASLGGRWEPPVKISSLPTEPITPSASPTISATPGTSGTPSESPSASTTPGTTPSTSTSPSPTGSTSPSPSP
jgi:hypothetical protein